MLQIKWTISQLERSLPDGTVMTAHWRVTATDEQFGAGAYGTQSFPAKEPSDPTFVPYEQITEEMVLSWLHATMGAEQVQAYETSIAQQIEKAKNPVSAVGTPW